jgi:biopolymer transport protein ExbD
MAFKLSDNSAVSWRHLKARKSATGEILFDLAPLVDIVFTLILFFMLTSPFITQWGIKITLPSLKNILPVANSETEITISENNDIFISGKLINKSALPASLQSLAKNNKSIAIVSDTKAQLGTVLEVRDLAIETGIKQISIRARVKNKPLKSKN